MKKHLQPDRIENYSGFRAGLGKIEILKKHQYYVTDQPVSGDAPKKFIKHYEYGSAAKRNPNKWPAFIAKTGHKWYPIESITEYLLNRLGPRARNGITPQITVAQFSPPILHTNPLRIYE